LIDLLIYCFTWLS